MPLFPTLPRRAKNIILSGTAICSVIGGVVLWKDAVAGKKFADKINEDEVETKKTREAGKVYVVTGANSGIGREIARDLAFRGAKVYMACRDVKACEKEREEIVLASRNKFVYCRKCDLASLESVRGFVAAFEAKESRLDGLVNNAGVMNCPRSFSADGIEMHLAVNHSGHFLLTHLLLDRLKSVSGSRVVFLVNLDYRKGSIRFEDLNFRQTYNQSEAFYQSQLANMLLVKQLAYELASSGVTVNAAYPGVCSTNIKRHMGVDKSMTGSMLSNPLLWLLTRSAERGSHTPLFVLLDPSLDKTTGKLFSNLKEIEVDAKCEDAQVAKRLVAVDKYWTGLVKSKEELLKDHNVRNT